MVSPEPQRQGDTRVRRSPNVKDKQEENLFSVGSLSCMSVNPSMDCGAGQDPFSWLLTLQTLQKGKHLKEGPNQSCGRAKSEEGSGGLSK